MSKKLSRKDDEETQLQLTHARVWAEVVKD